jgi:hypothetical protein
MNRLIAIVPIVAAAMTSGCIITSTKTETRTYNHANFDSIDASAGVDVVLTQGPFSVRAEAPEGNLDRIEIEQEGSELRLSRKSEMTWFGISGRYVVHVAAPAITKINVSGGADLDANGLSGDALALSASGGGDMDIAGLKVNTLTASTSGGGDIEAAGTCQSATIDASGGGDFNGDHLDCATAIATASGGGDIDIRASLSASGKASAGGDINFIGAPATFTKDESSGGDVSLEAP